MLRACLLAVLVGSALCSELTEKKPETPDQDHIVPEETTVKICIRPGDVPQGVVAINIKAKAIRDLTGDRYEKGYDLAYNSAIPCIYYPGLNAGNYYVFMIRYCKADGECSLWSVATEYEHSIKSDYWVEKLSRDWAMAKEKCIDDGGRLASIPHSKQNKEIVTLLKLYPEIQTAWIGLWDKNYNNTKKSTVWEWLVPNVHVHYTNWAYTGATIHGSTLNTSAVVINRDGFWETRDPTESHYIVCEKGHTETPNPEEARVGIREERIVKIV